MEASYHHRATINFIDSYLHGRRHARRRRKRNVSLFGNGFSNSRGDLPELVNLSRIPTHGVPHGSSTKTEEEKFLLKIIGGEN